MFVGSEATGRPYHLQFSKAKETVVAFQNIARDQERTRSPFLITLLCFHALQFSGTVWIYCKILYLAYMSTTKVATLEVVQDNLVNLTDTTNTNQVNQNRHKNYWKC